MAQSGPDSVAFLGLRYPRLELGQRDKVKQFWDTYYPIVQDRDLIMLLMAYHQVVPGRQWGRLVLLGWQFCAALSGAAHRPLIKNSKGARQ